MKYQLDEEQKKLIEELVDSRFNTIVDFYKNKAITKEEQQSTIIEVMNYVTDISKENTDYIECIKDRKSRRQNISKWLPLSNNFDLSLYNNFYDLWALYNGNEHCLKIIDQKNRFPSQNVDKSINNSILLDTIRSFTQEFFSHLQNDQLKSLPNSNTYSEQFSASANCSQQEGYATMILNQKSLAIHTKTATK